MLAAMRPVFEEITAISDAFCADHLDEEYAWLVEINGYLAEARQLPEDVQVYLAERGVIPFVPSREDGA